MKAPLLVGLSLACVLLAFWLWTPDRSRSQLESRYLAAPGDLIDVMDWHLHVRDSGPKDAPAVILIHGFGASLQTWGPWAQELSKDLRVILFDLPGSGLSAPDPAGDYSDTRSIELLIALMDRLGVSRAHLVGHSIGGRIAWTFAARHPERVDRLVLIAPDGFASPGFEYGKPPEVPAMLTVMRYVLPRPLLRMNLQSAYANPEFLTDELIMRYYDLILAPGARDALLARLRQTVLFDPVPLLKSIQAPTLLVWGSSDAMIPFANSEEYLKYVPDIRRLSVPDVGHLPQEEAPPAVIGSVHVFLKAGGRP